MADPFIAQIYLVGYNFAQRDFAFCAGQLMAIAQNTAMFSLVGTAFGGDGQTTFGLPNLQGRVAIGMGQGPGLSFRSMGEISGTEQNTLTIGQMPAHNHTATLQAVGDLANTEEPGNSALAISSGGQIYNNQITPTAPMKGLSVGVAGAGQPFNNMPPYLVLNYEIALRGIYPSRN